MLGNQVANDLNLINIESKIPSQLPWGKHEFTKQLLNPTSHAAIIKRRQLPLLAFRNDVQLQTSICAILQSLAPHIQTIEDCLKPKDSIHIQAFQQIFWDTSSIAARMNTISFVIQTIIAWKTIALPAMAILAPVLGIIVPYFLLHFLDKPTSPAAYLEQLKNILLKQIRIPTFLQSKGDHDRVGFILQSLFIGGTIAMFVSGLWNQVNMAKHIRSIWNMTKSHGDALYEMVGAAKSILYNIKTVSAKSNRMRIALHGLYTQGKTIYDVCTTSIFSNNVSTFGSVWNNPAPFLELKAWLGQVDAYVAIASISDICMCQIDVSSHIAIKDFIHPCVETCIPNSYTSSTHSLVTGPNRGGKSTFCKALALSIVCMQSWGFAWAKSMKSCTFDTITTSLETYGKLGHASTFEAEIQFAKGLLKLPNTHRKFIMMDEIFHSTNAYDGAHATKVFLSKLYEMKNCISVISTHYRELPSLFSKQATPYQMITHGPDDALQYTYRLGEGVSQSSSVMELLREYGLISYPDAAETLQNKHFMAHQKEE